MSGAGWAGRLGRSALAAGLWGLVVAAWGADVWQGRVTRVTDGDTVWVQPQRGGAPVKVRLLGLDAPERCQAQGTEATRALAQRVMQQAVRVESVVTDDYGRVVARLWLGRTDVGAAQVAAGWAWSESYRGHEGVYAAEERAAREARRGLFRAGMAESPREFRRRHGPCPMR